MINRKQIALGVALLMASPMSMAAVSDADFQALKDSIAALTQKLADMEKEMAAEKAKSAEAATAAAAAAGAAANTAPPAVAAKPAAASWTDKVSLQGDLRYRYDTIDQEGSDNRNRERFRARAAIVAKPVDKLEMGFGLSTAQDASPTSNNQTIGGGGTPKDVYVNLAYFNWAALDGLNLIGGKFKNYLYKPGQDRMIWDPDLNPEGLGATYVKGPFFANALMTWIESDSGSNNKATGIGGQAGFAWPLTDTLKFTAGGGYYDLGTKGNTAFYVVPGKSAKYYGNTTVLSDPNDANSPRIYAYDYKEIEGFAELGFRLFGQPANVFFDYVTNTDADNFDRGWSAGVTLGAAKGKGTWEATYMYQDLQADAVFALWTDDDFGGGGTDTRGSVFRGAYALTDRTNLAFSYFLTQFGKDAGNELDYNRLQLDMNFKY